MKKTFFRYIFSGFWLPFLFGLGTFTALIFFGMLFDKLNIFINMNVSARLFAGYMLFQIPYYVNQVVPMATLLAVLFSLGSFLKGGEWKAGLAGGYSPKYMILPLLACSAMTAAFHLAWQEAVAPGPYARSGEIYESKIKGFGRRSGAVKKDFFFATEGNFVYASKYDAAKKEMKLASAEENSGGGKRKRITARKAAWNGEKKRWIFYDGVIAEYEAGKPVLKKFSVYQSNIRLPVGVLSLKELVYDGINIKQLLERIRSLGDIGIQTFEEETFVWLKLAYPISNVVMALIGIAVIFILEKPNKMFNMGIAILSGFLLWASMTVGASAGRTQVLSPFWAGFSPLLVFLALSLAGLKKARII